MSNEERKMVIGVDLAPADSADYTGIVFASVDVNRNCYILNLFNGKLPTKKEVERILSPYRKGEDDVE